MNDLKFSLNYLDFIVFALYAMTIIFLGFKASSVKNEDQGRESFLLAGRKLTLPLFVASLVSTWYGNILGVGEFVYSNGIVAWACFGLPYYIAGTLFAFFISKKVRESKVHSIPEQIENKFGTGAGKIASLLVLVISVPAAYVLMIGIIIQMISGFSLFISILIGAVISSVYLFKGGLKSDVMANSAQFVLMFVGFIILLVFSVSTFGSPSNLSASLPENHLKLFGTFSLQMILSWYLIAFQTFVDPSFHQRCSAALNSKTAKNGILISVLFWALFDLLTLLTGLYARAMFSGINPVYAYPMLSNAILPHFWKGLFIVSMLSPIMASFDGYAFISAATIGNDLLDPIFRKRGKKMSIRMLTNIGLVLTLILAILLAMLLPSAIQLIYKTASIAVPALLLPLIFSFSRKIQLKSGSLILIMIISAMVSFIWTILQFNSEKLPDLIRFSVINIEPMIAGIVVSIIVSIFVFLFGRKKYVDTL